MILYILEFLGDFIQGDIMTSLNRKLKGKKIEEIEGLEQDSEQIRIYFNTGEVLFLYHMQDCSETVFVEQVDGDPKRHEGAIFYELEEKIDDPELENRIDYVPPMEDSYTWTFYTLKTSKGYLDFRWFGTSNGYYSETVEWSLFQ